LLSDPDLRFVVNSQLLFDHFGQTGLSNIATNGHWFEPANQRSDGIDARFSFGTATDIPLAGIWASPPALLAAGGLARQQTTVAPLTMAQLDPIVDQAIAAWSTLGLAPSQQQLLDSAQIQIADLPGAQLGQAAGRTITLDATAAGYGWFVDDADLDASQSSYDLRPATFDSQARVDLLTVLPQILAIPWSFDSS